MLFCLALSAYSQVGIKTGVGLFSGIALVPGWGLETNYKIFNMSMMYANSDWQYIPYIYGHEPVFEGGTVHTFDLSSRIMIPLSQSMSVYAGGGVVLNTVFGVDSAVYPYIGGGFRFNFFKIMFFDFSGGAHFGGMELNLNADHTESVEFDMGSPYIFGLALGIRFR